MRTVETTDMGPQMKSHSIECFVWHLSMFDFCVLHHDDRHFYLLLSPIALKAYFNLNSNTLVHGTHFCTVQIYASFFRVVFFFTQIPWPNFDCEWAADRLAIIQLINRIFSSTFSKYAKVVDELDVWLFSNILKIKCAFLPHWRLHNLTLQTVLIGGFLKKTITLRSESFEYEKGSQKTAITLCFCQNWDSVW